MYIYAGNNKMIRTSSIIGIFELDRATKKTAVFLAKAEKEGNIEHLWSDMPRSFIVTDKKIYFTQTSVKLLTEREY